MLAQCGEHCMAQNNVCKWVDEFKQLLVIVRLVFNISNQMVP